MKPSSLPPRPPAWGALLLALGACTLPTGGPQNTYAGGAGKLEIQRIVGNPQLARNLEIVDPIAKMVDGTQIAQCELRSNVSSTLRFVWAVEWYDADGFLINGPDRVSEPVTLPGHGSKTLKLVAPKRGEGLTWKLLIAPPDEVR